MLKVCDHVKDCPLSESFDGGEEEVNCDYQEGMERSSQSNKNHEWLNIAGSGLNIAGSGHTDSEFLPDELEWCHGGVD